MGSPLNPSAQRLSGGPAPPYAGAKPVFGVHIQELFDRDSTPVPDVVTQCILAVDLYGLEHEGIYRTSGNAGKVAQLKSQFDHDTTTIDFRYPEAFFHDVNITATLLKNFLRELPDPLLTKKGYRALLDAAAVPDDIQRRDRLHASINSLPDPNYATLRALILHLHRVIQYSEQNRMSANSLAVIFAPTLMGGQIGPVHDAALQHKVVETILNNALEIFDED